MSQIKLGSHVGMAGKEMFLASVKEAKSYGANILMLYTGAPQNTRRKEISELTEGQDPEKFWIILDHQPAEYAKVQQAGGGLIVSGHTHAGQIWPLGLFASLFHFDDMNYGYRQMDTMQALVTSGIAGWGFPIRTEKHCEYLIVNLVPEA